MSMVMIILYSNNIVILWRICLQVFSQKLCKHVPFPRLPLLNFTISIGRFYFIFAECN